MTFPKYPKYKDSGVEWLGEVPEGWTVKRLKRNVRLLTEKTKRREHPVALENIESWTGKFIETDTELEGDGIAFEPSDILFGKLRPYLAKAYLAEFSGEAVGDFHVFRPVKDVEPHFLQYQILNVSFISLVDGSTYGSKMPRASWDFVGGIELPIPPIGEQTIITNFLDQETAKIDTLVSEQKRLIELLKEKRQAVISHAVTKGLDPHVKMKDSGVEWLGEVPEHWEVKRLRHIGEAFGGLTYEPSELVEEGCGVLVLRSSNVQKGVIVFDDNVYVATTITEKKITQIGDILICSRNGSRDLIGKNAMIEKDSSGITFGAFMMVFRSKNSRYIFHVFNSHLFKFQSAAFLTATINQLTVGNLYSMEAPLPPPDEQQMIAAFLDQETAKIDSLITEAQRAIDLLQERRSALISAAVTGQIDVRSLTEKEAS